MSAPGAAGLGYVYEVLLYKVTVYEKLANCKKGSYEMSKFQSHWYMQNLYVYVSMAETHSVQETVKNTLKTNFWSYF